MKLSERAVTQIQTAANAFARQISEVVSADVSSDTKASVIDQLRATIDRIAGLGGGGGGRGGRRPGAGAKPAPAPTAAAAKGAPRKRRFLKLDSRLMGKFVAAIREAGGEASPGDVSKKLGLSSFQRRRVVRAAKKAGLMKTVGNKRSTRYILLKSK